MKSLIEQRLELRLTSDAAGIPMSSLTKFSEHQIKMHNRTTADDWKAISKMVIQSEEKLDYLTAPVTVIEKGAIRPSLKELAGNRYFGLKFKATLSSMKRRKVEYNEIKFSKGVKPMPKFSQGQARFQGVLKTLDFVTGALNSRSQAINALSSFEDWNDLPEKI